MLFAVSGSGGSGKTSVLSILRDMGYNTIERKTSRSILQDWNVTLLEVNSNPELTMKFQKEIIARKWDDEAEARESNEIWFTERSYLDLVAYSTVILGHRNELSDWVDTYVEECIVKHHSYDAVFFLKAGHFNVVHDGVRGSNSYYSTLVDLFLEHMLVQHTLPGTYVPVLTPVLTHRVQLISNIVDALWNKQQKVLV